MINNRNMLLAVLAGACISGQLFGSQPHNQPRVMQFLLHVIEPYISPYNGAVAGSGLRKIDIKEGYDRTDMNDQTKISSKKSNALLQQYKNSALDAYVNKKQTDQEFQLNGKNYKTEITPIRNLNDTCDKLTVIITEVNQ